MDKWKPETDKTKGETKVVGLSLCMINLQSKISIIILF